MPLLTAKESLLTLTVRGLELQDYARPELWNPPFQTLLNNDAALAKQIATLDEKFLPKSGGTFDGVLELANGAPIRSRTADGALTDLLVLDSDGDVIVGGVSRRLRLHSAVDPVVQVADKAYMVLHTGNHAGKSSEVHGIAAPYRVAKTSDAEGFVSWNELKNRPTALPPGPHNHNDLYYTKSEGDGRYVRQYGESRIRGSIFVGDTQYNNGGGNILTLSIGDNYTGFNWQTLGELQIWANGGLGAIVTKNGTSFRNTAYLRYGDKDIWHGDNLKIWTHYYNFVVNGNNRLGSGSKDTFVFSFPEAKIGDQVLVALPPNIGSDYGVVTIAAGVHANGFVNGVVRNDGNATSLATNGWKVTVIRPPE